jgi:hypothetical protein
MKVGFRRFKKVKFGGMILVFAAVKSTEAALKIVWLINNFFL